MNKTVRFAMFGVATWGALAVLAAPVLSNESSIALQKIQDESAPEKTRSANVKERTAVGKIIRAQLNAFARDDYKTAIIYQSAALKKNFATPDAFRRMMRATYPQFARYKSITFGRDRINMEGTRLEIVAKVIGQDKVKVDCVYQMTLENKAWRVAGVAGGAQLRTKPSVEV